MLTYKNTGQEYNRQYDTDIPHTANTNNSVITDNTENTNIIHIILGGSKIPKNSCMN